MNNQDMPANPQSFAMVGVEPECGTALTHLSESEVEENMGETKREKAFWQVYSAMIASVVYVDADQELIAQEALKAVNAGFKALEGDGDE